MQALRNTGAGYGVGGSTRSRPRSTSLAQPIPRVLPPAQAALVTSGLDVQLWADAPQPPTPQPAVPWPLMHWTDDLTTDWATGVLGRPVSRVVINDPEELEQSEVCRLEVYPAGTASPMPLSLLLKRYHLPRLMRRIPKPEEKWRITATSFINEYSFLAAPEVLSQLKGFMAPYAGIPAVLHSSHWVCQDDWFNRQFDFVFELYDSCDYYQKSQLNLPEATAAMVLLARFHAFFWRSKQAELGGACPGMSPQALAQWQAVYPRGAWWRKQLRPSVKYERLPAAFQGLCDAFPEQQLFGALNTPGNHETMARMAACVDRLNDALATAPDRTLVHGDLKTSNIFFRRPPAPAPPSTALLAAPSSHAQPGSPHVASAAGMQARASVLQAHAIDFQWTGRAPSGLADVVYCLYGGVQYDVVVQHGQHLQNIYLGALHAALCERGLDPELECSRDWFNAHMAAETLGYTMTALPQLLDGLTPATCADNSGKYGWLTHEQDPRCAALLCSKALEAMQLMDRAGGPEELVAVRDVAYVSHGSFDALLA